MSEKANPPAEDRGPCGQRELGVSGQHLGQGRVWQTWVRWEGQRLDLTLMGFGQGNVTRQVTQMRKEAGLGQQGRAVGLGGGVELWVGAGLSQVTVQCRTVAGGVRMQPQAPAAPTGP